MEKKNDNFNQDGSLNIPNRKSKWVTNVDKYWLSLHAIKHLI